MLKNASNLWHVVLIVKQLNFCLPNLLLDFNKIEFYLIR